MIIIINHSINQLTWKQEGYSHLELIAR